MNFTTHTESGKTKNHSTLNEAMEYAEDEDDVVKISFSLPTNEKMVLERGFEGWVYDPLGEDGLIKRLVLSDLEAEVLDFCRKENPDDTAPYRYWQTMDVLAARGLLEVIEEEFTTSTFGERLLRLHNKR